MTGDIRPAVSCLHPVFSSKGKVAAEAKEPEAWLRTRSLEGPATEAVCHPLSH